MKKYNNLCKYMIGILVLIYIGFMIFINILTPDKVFSENENRRLEQRLQFSMENLFKGTFTSDYEKYVSDQFPFRDFFIGIKSDCERLIGKKENNEVYLCKDGYLMEKFDKPDDKEFEKKIKSINSFATQNFNIDKYFMLVPNSVKVLEDKLPLFLPVEDELIYMDKVKNSLHKSIKFVDVYDKLCSKNDEYIYYKTDHHWTTKGAFYAYENLCESMGFAPHSEDYFNIKKVTDNFYGSLYSKSGFRHLNADYIELCIPKKDEGWEVEYFGEGKVFNSIYNMENLNKKDKYTVFLGGNYPLLKIKTSVPNEKVLLMIKDSYANSFIPFLTGHFSEIYVVDLRYYNDDLSSFIKNKKIDDILILYNEKSFFEDESVKKIAW